MCSQGGAQRSVLRGKRSNTVKYFASAAITYKRQRNMQPTRRFRSARKSSQVELVYFPALKQIEFLDDVRLGLRNASSQVPNCCDDWLNSIRIKDEQQRRYQNYFNFDTRALRVGLLSIPLAIGCVARTFANWRILKKAALNKGS